MLAANSRLGAALGRLRTLPLAAARLETRVPRGLVLVPHDLRTGDATIASDLYRGAFSLAGSRVDIGARSPFDVPPPNPEWRDSLHGFGWLRHLRAADNDISRLYARALISDWIESHGSGRGPGWSAPVLARRIMAWLYHSPVFLDDTSPDYYRTVMKSLTQQYAQLQRSLRVCGDGVPRMVCAMALNFAALCLGGQEKRLGRAIALLEKELERQILPDGGHFSRHPGAAAEILLDLLPLRQTFTARDMEPPQKLVSAIDRMMPMVRFIRHGDGHFALFNGMSVSAPGVAAAVLALDDVQGKPPFNAQHSGYQRIEAERTLILMDTGTAPPLGVSARAHAGCLSFELSSGSRRIVVNCGAPALPDANWREVARTTAAHSTLTVAGRSSAVFLRRPFSGKPGDILLTGPEKVNVRRERRDGHIVVEASHDGYRKEFGILHVRHLKVSIGGGRLDGEDRLVPAATSHLRRKKQTEAVIRFHLHPSAQAILSQDGKTVMLDLADGENWRFSAAGEEIGLEESVFLADKKGPRKTRQIVIYCPFELEKVVKWLFRRIMADKPGKHARHEAKEG